MANDLQMLKELQTLLTLAIANVFQNYCDNLDKPEPQPMAEYHLRLLPVPPENPEPETEPVNSFLNIEQIAARLAVQPATVSRWLQDCTNRRVAGEKALPFTSVAEEKFVKLSDVLRFLETRKNYIWTPSIRKKWPGIESTPFFTANVLSQNGLVSEAKITKMFEHRAKRNIWNLIKPAGWSILAGSPASRLYHEADVVDLEKIIRAKLD